MTNPELKEEKHHIQLELCTTRPAYRQGRKLTSVRVYTINGESQHLFVYGVPSINLRSELKNLCSKYGKVLSIHVNQGYKTEVFTECYHVQFERIQSARIAKRLIDNRSFYGGILHVCYAPEHESLDETRKKLLQRNTDVINRLPGARVNSNISHDNIERKRKLNEASKTVSVKKARVGKMQLPDIYSEDDPILRSFIHSDNKNNSNEDSNTKEIGPTFPSNNDLARTSTKMSEEINKSQFVPRQVKISEKRIVFRKKIINNTNVNI